MFPGLELLSRRRGRECGQHWKSECEKAPADHGSSCGDMITGAKSPINRVFSGVRAQKCPSCPPSGLGYYYCVYSTGSGCMVMPPPNAQDRASYRATSIRAYKIAIKQ